MNFPFPKPKIPDSIYVQNKVCGVEIPHPALQRGWLHCRQLRAKWDSAKIASTIGSGCWLSHYGTDTSAENDPGKVRLMVWVGFWPSGGFVEFYQGCNNPNDEHPLGTVAVYAGSPAAAQALLDELYRDYRVTNETNVPEHRIGFLHESYGDIEVRRVPISPSQVIARQDCLLYYGNGFPDWLDQWIDKMAARRYGLSLLSGAPGTGKTSLIRSMAHWLAKTHQFYVMSASRFTQLEAGEIVTFWAEENRTSRLRKVLILEDAESVLMRRDSDNRERVALLLNLTDGMTGDALGLQVVCTLNGEVSELDPALLRPGRLVAHHEFGPLSAVEAERLARHLDLGTKVLNRPMTLAEIMNPPDAAVASVRQEVNRRRAMGFMSELSRKSQ